MMHHTEAKAKKSSQPLSFLRESVWERAAELGNEGRHAAAASEYQYLSDMDPDDPRASLKLAHHLIAGGFYGRAADEYLRLAAIYARQGRPSRAITIATRALRLEPRRVVRARLAPIVEALGTTATSLCEQVSRAHLMAGRREEAKQILCLLVHCDADALPRRLQLAELDLAGGHTAEALTNLKIVADGLRNLGRTEELLKVLEMMHVHGGSDETVLRELATIYVRCGQPRRALVKLQALHRLAPNDRATLERLARVHASLGQLQRAVSLLEQLVALIDEHGDRGEMRAMLSRASSWCSDVIYQGAIETLCTSGLRPAMRVVAEHRAVEPRITRSSAPMRLARRRGAPPPPPRWSRRRSRAQSAARDAQWIDADELELVADDARSGDPSERRVTQ